MSSREFRRPPPRKLPACVPRRFSIGTLLVFATLYSLLFAVLSCFNVWPSVFLAITVFLTGVGVAQVLLFNGKNPRAASTIAGIVLCPLIVVCLSLYETRLMRDGVNIEGILYGIISWGTFSGAAMHHGQT